MSTGDIALWASFALAAASFIYAIYTGRSKKHDERFEKVDERFEKIESDLAHKSGVVEHAALRGKVDLIQDRLLGAENELKHLPDKDIVHRLEVQLSSVNGGLARLEERMKPIAAMADRMQEAMLEKVMS